MALPPPRKPGAPAVRIRPDAVEVPLRRPGEYLPQRRAAPVRPVRAGELDAALGLLLAGGEGAGPDGWQIDAFKQWAQGEQCDLTRMMVAVQRGRVRHACLFVPQAGGVAFVWASRPAGTESMPRAAQTVRETCQWAFRLHCRLLQMLLEPGDRERGELCRQSGFRPLTDLIYLVRPAGPPKAPPAAPLPPEGCNWLTYAPEHHQLFRDVLVRSYVESRDCPELSEWREVEDALAAHQGAGVFEPRYWQVLLHEGKGVGVLLLTRLRSGEAMELTYMGLCPTVRGRGWGRVLLEQALWLAHGAGGLSLTLAVDCRNQPARRLYEQFGFAPILRRSVYLRSVRWVEG